MGSSLPESPSTSPDLVVLFDGACPLCRREISVYLNLHPVENDTTVRFVDISNAAQPLPAGITQEQLLARFHVQQPNGELLSGAEAFLALWAVLPGWRWLAFLCRFPGAVWLMEKVYRLFLHWRPTLQRWVVRLDRTHSRPRT